MPCLLTSGKGLIAVTKRLSPFPGLLTPFFLTLCFLILLLGFPETSAQAQTVDKRIERIEKQLRAVQRKVFGSPDAAPAAVGEPASGNQMADIEVRLQGMENQIRSLNGQVEELRFQLEETNRKLEKFQADAEFRFGQLEQGGAGAAAPSAPVSASGGAVPSAASPAVAQPSVAAKPAASAPSAAAGSGTLPAGTPMEQYEYAYNLLAKGDYVQAETALRAFLDKHPKDELAGNAQYWLAQSYFVRGENEKAAREFLTGYQNYPDSPKAAAYLLKIGITLTRIGQTKDACDVFQELSSRYPSSPEAKTRLTDARKDAGCN